MDRNQVTTRSLDSFPDELAVAVPRIARGLSVLDDDYKLSLQVAGTRNRYVQFVTFDGNLRAESVGNRYLEGNERLGEAELAWLAGHGWNEPDAGGNHWRHWEPADSEAAAVVALVTLHVVHGVEMATELVITSGSAPVMAAVLGGDR